VEFQSHRWLQRVPTQRIIDRNENKYPQSCNKQHVVQESPTITDKPLSQNSKTSIYNLQQSIVNTVKNK